MKTVPLLLVFALVQSGFFAPALAGGERPRLVVPLVGPTTINQPGYYYLVADIKGPVVIEADDVHVDLRGFTLNAFEAEYYNGHVELWPIEALVAESVDNLTIENGRISIADPAMVLDSVRNFTVRDMEIFALSDVWIDGMEGVIEGNHVFHQLELESAYEHDEDRPWAVFSVSGRSHAVRHNVFDRWLGMELFVSGDENLVANNTINKCLYCYGSVLGVFGNYNVIVNNNVAFGGDSGTALHVRGSDNIVRENVVNGGGEEVGGGGVAVIGDSNLIEGNSVEVRLTWYFPFIIGGNHNAYSGNRAVNSADRFYPVCPAEPGNWTFCDYGLDDFSGGGNYLPGPR